MIQDDNILLVPNERIVWFLFTHFQTLTVLNHLWNEHQTVRSHPHGCFCLGLHSDSCDKYLSTFLLLVSILSIQRFTQIHVNIIQEHFNHIILYSKNSQSKSIFNKTVAVSIPLCWLLGLIILLVTRCYWYQGTQNCHTANNRFKLLESNVVVKELDIVE